MQKFSVIIPCFKAAATLPATLASIAAQTHPASEVICIDDGSTDATQSIVAAIAAQDPRVRLARNPGKGPSAARNHGALTLATVDIVAFCNADDVWSPTKLGELATAFADPATDAAYGQVAFFRHQPQDAAAFSTVPDQPLTIPMLLGENPICTMSNIAIRQTRFAATGGFDSRMVHNEDLEWLIRLAGTGARIVGLDLCQTWYRACTGGLSADLEAMTRGRATALETAARFGHVPGPAAKAIYQRYLARRSLRLGQGRVAPLRYALRGLAYSPAGFFSAPRRGVMTLAAACAALVLPRGVCQSLFAR